MKKMHAGRFVMIENFALICFCFSFILLCLIVIMINLPIGLQMMPTLKDNSTMDRTEAQIVSFGILYLNPSSHQCQPSYM